MAEQDTTTAATTPEFTWPKPSKTLFSEYLKARVSAAPDAPHTGKPFITEKGILRVKPSDWLGWLGEQGIDAPKIQALRALKDLGMVQRVYPLPALDSQPALKGKSYGLYSGPAPTGTKTLPRYTSPGKVRKEPAGEPAKAAAKKPASKKAASKKASTTKKAPQDTPAAETTTTPDNEGAAA